MFTKEIYETQLSPVFLNSILMNASLYDMFKNEFEDNKDYFRNIPKDIYLEEILKHIEENLENITMIERIKTFYDDFVLPKIREDENNIFYTKFFKILSAIDTNGKDELEEFFMYVFATINYPEIEGNIIEPLKEKLSNGEKLNANEFDLLMNYVKNNIHGIIDMQFINDLIRAHAYKKNHIFESEVVEELVKSTAHAYLSKLDIEPIIEFTHDLFYNADNIEDLKENRIIIKSILVDTFISGNYVELFNDLIYKLNVIYDISILKTDNVDYDLFRTLLNMINYKVDISKIYMDNSYNCYNYTADMKASSFLRTLIFYQDLGVNLIPNFIKSKIKYVKFNEMNPSISLKEHGLSMHADNRILKMDKEKWSIYYNNYEVLRIIYNSDGTKRRTIDIIKSKNNIDFIREYLYGEIMNPDIMIEDIGDLCSYNTKDEEKSKLVENLLKYIYVDTFYYSLNSYLDMHKDKSNFDMNQYIGDLQIKINCLKDTPLTHRFIDEALKVIEYKKQSD